MLGLRIKNIVKNTEECYKQILQKSVVGPRKGAFHR
jgi:hypothetical protein